MDDLSKQSIADQLTHRELEIMRLIAEGRANQHIAERLFITLGTVKWYLKQIYSKLQVSSRTQAVAAVRASGLLDGTGTPAKAEPSASPHNLPHQMTEFVGREEELATLATLLTNTRLVTILGPGGIGKTRLALETAQAEVPHFADGIFFVSLAPLGAPESMILAIAEAVRFSFYGDLEPKQQLCDFLRAKRLLLVLDNIEHLLAGVGLVTEMLQAAPSVKVLATSRERLNIDGETLFRLDGMNFPNWETPEHAAEYGAVKLFLQSARRVQPGFGLEVNNLKYVARICRLVQGMPLGILLAAAWVEALGLPEIAQEIEKSLNFLETEQRDVPERQRSLRATFDYSWKMLIESEREVFRKLSVFRGGFTREAAQQVANASLKVLMTLVNKSLLRRDASTGRYDIHELLRQFGEEQLDASPAEREHTYQLHSEFYADYMRLQWKAMMSPRQGAVYDEIVVEYNNVLAAWNDVVTNRRAALLRRMAFSLFYFCAFRIPGPDSTLLFKRAAEALETISPDEETEIARGLMLAMQGGSGQDRLAPMLQGKDLMAKGIVILRRHDCPDESIFALGWFGLVVGTGLHQFDEAERACQEGLQIAREQHSQWGLGWCLTWWAHSVATRGDLVWARELAEEGFRASAAVSDLALISHNVVYVQGPIALELGDYAEAERLFEQAIEWYKVLENPGGSRLADARLFIGKVAILTSDYSKAKSLLQQGLAYCKRTGHLGRNVFEGVFSVGRLFAAQGRQADAVEICSVLQVLQYTGPDEIVIRDLAAGFLIELQAILPADVYSAAVERGKSLDFDSVVAEFLAT